MTADPNEPLFGNSAASPASGSVATPWLRLGEALLSGLLIIVTLVIGYLVWTLILWSEGQSPAKKLLGMKVVSSETGETFTFQQMFMRNFVFGFVVFGVIGAVLGLISVVLRFALPLVDALMIFSGTKRQRLLDRLAKSQVVMV